MDGGASVRDLTDRILHVIASADLGGAEVYVENAVRAAGGDILAFADGPMRARWEAAGARVEIVPAPGKLPLRALAPIRKAITDLAPRVLFTHATKASFLANLSAPVGIPRVVFVHGGHRQYSFARSLPAGFYRMAERVAARGARAVVAVTRRDAEELAWAGFPSSRLRVVPAGVADPGPPAAGVDASRRRDARAILWIGRLSPEKAPEAFVGIWKRLRGRGVRGEAILAGDGPLADRVRPMAVAEGIEVVPGTPDPGPLYARAAIVLLTSHTEGLPLVVLEAASRAIPLVLPDLPGLREAMGRAATGGEVACFFPPGDLDRAADACEKLLADPARREALGARARRRYLSEFSLERFAARLRGLAGAGGREA